MVDGKKKGAEVAKASAPSPSPTPAPKARTADKPVQPTTCWQAERVVDFTSPKDGVEGGKFYRIGSVVAYARHNTPAGRRFQAVTAGLFVSAPKSGGAWAEGEALEFDAESQSFKAGSTAPVAYAELAAAAGDTTGRVRLIGALS